MQPSYPSDASRLPSQSLNICGLICPEPIMLLRQKLRNMSPGELLEAFADDPTTQKDIPDFCRFMGHALVYHRSEPLPYCYLIKKGA